MTDAGGAHTTMCVPRALSGRRLSPDALDLGQSYEPNQPLVFVIYLVCGTGTGLPHLAPVIALLAAVDGPVGPFGLEVWKARFPPVTSYSWLLVLSYGPRNSPVCSLVRCGASGSLSSCALYG